MEKPSWQRRRETFNHDWLKNQYLQSLGETINLFCGRIEKPGMEWTLAEALIAAWESHSAEGAWLIDHYDLEMSPCTLFRCPPLSRSSAEIRAWLPVVVHVQWRSRFLVPERVAVARAKFARAGRSLEELRLALEGPRKSRSYASLQKVLPVLQGLQRSCEELAGAIEQFCSKVEVI